MKILKIETPKKTVIIVLKWNSLFFHCSHVWREDAREMTNIVDPDQTAPIGAV